MTDKIRGAWEQVTLSPQADERIRTALADAQQAQKVIPLRRGLRRTTRIALVAAVIIGLLSVTALGINIGRIALRTENVPVTGPDGDTSEVVEIVFEPTTDESTQMGIWTLDVPEGFEEGEPFHRVGVAKAHWANADGKSINLTYVAADREADFFVEKDFLEEREVTIKGVPGQLYIFEDSSRLFWTDDEIGVGFELWCNDNTIDLPALANTAHQKQVDEKPQLNEDTLEAIADFGDWNPTAMPGNYREYTSGGAPAKYGGPDGYGYVFRTYVNDDGSTIELYYKVARGDEGYEPHVSHWRTLPGYSVQDVTVQGQPAGLILNKDGSPWRLVWICEDGSLVFDLMCSNLTTEELLAVAESVALAP